MCWEYIDIIASNIPQMKIKAVSQWTARFNIQKNPKKCWCLLRNLSFRLFDHKKIPGLFQNFTKIPGLSRTPFKFQDFSGLVKTMSLSIFPQSSPVHTICLQVFQKWHAHALSKNSKLCIIGNFIWATGTSHYSNHYWNHWLLTVNRAVTV